jgi:hypothetical protein
MAESTEPVSTTDERTPIEELQRRLNEWRTRIDELVVQLDLANMELREAFATELAKLENAGSALRSGLGYAKEDVRSAVPADRAAISEALRDLERAFQAARATLERR